ncbi:Eco57I restriction-modification methylase domain-containing protein [Terriglobus roseus]|uniref:site-specific DNA-methyltransferase (adenine-specific) n=1 Tax=Terriglobus roseus TaxID=392734 RepID=A0A1G7JH11_9BACT|nr:Eco57I restriction-modification methylase domain-containing protein [Terriglobus roseus]SDF24145.1 site-specific DNA-methyltransferase (adenine-specific) [Terriglobus roseus]
MIDQASFTLRGRNPDVLTCIANLSNDEVFTPPEFANRMLDTLAEAWAASNDGANLWADSSVRFLDPFTKSGVFLREITNRLTKGLATEIPDLQERVNHILTKQVFGIAITRLTSFLARRSLYCSKHANGPHSIATTFSTEEGNIWFERTEHKWSEGRCLFCGANKETLDRGKGVENYAYAFIHAKDIGTRVAEMFGGDMQFDVVIGNPPYQLSDGGQGASAMPIYNKFVDQAKALDPKFLVMVIPARWLFGGRGLDAFRNSMLEDRRVRKLVDFPDSRQAFESVDVAGGVCYFLWNRDDEGDCEVVTNDLHGNQTSSIRPLMEPGASVFIRNSESIAILRKIAAKESGNDANGIALPPERRFDSQVSGQKPFGLRTFFRGDKKKRPDDLLVQQNGGTAWVARKTINEGVELIDKWKVFTSKSSSEHAGQADRNGMRRVLSLTGILPPGSVVTETYVILGAYDSELEAQHCLSYVTTKFFRFLVATRTSAQDLPRIAYSFVPVQDFSGPWNDERLYTKYGLNADEIALVDSTIRPMDVSGDLFSVQPTSEGEDE